MFFVERQLCLVGRTCWQQTGSIIPSSRRGTRLLEAREDVMNDGREERMRNMLFVFSECFILCEAAEREAGRRGGG